MELRHIRYFLAVAEERNFTRAAARIGIAQPPLSQQIKDLETEVGALLFHRLNQGVELTEAGQAFHAVVRDMPGTAEKAKLTAQRAARGEIGALRLGFSDSSAYEPVISTTIRDYRQKYPDVDVGLEVAPTGRLIHELRDDNLDVVFLRSRETISPIDGLHVRALVVEPLIAALPAAHPKATADDLSLMAFKDDPFILLHASAGPMNAIVREACDAAGFEPTLGPSASQAGSVLTYVASGLGVALLPVTMKSSRLDGVVFRDLSDGPMVGLCIAWRRGDHSAAVRNFVALADR